MNPGDKSWEKQALPEKMETIERDMKIKMTRAVL